MVIDSSVLVAIFEGEPEAALFSTAMERAPKRWISTGSVLEATAVLVSKRGPAARGMLDDFIRQSSVEIVPFDGDQLDLARSAFMSYGKGRHPAKLNFGDCMSYSLARWLGQPLLFKGDDFSKTDIRPAV
jgi:ribonuclease VapC